MKADIYSFGAMVFALIFKTYPYKTKPTKTDRLYKFIAKQDYEGLWDHLKRLRKDIENVEPDPDALLDILMTTLSPDPLKRPAAKQLTKHKWFTSN